MYKKELRKVQILLGIGFILSLFIFFKASASVADNIIKGSIELILHENMSVLLLVLFYPLGVFYNFRRMMGLIAKREYHAPADRYYTVNERNLHHSMNLSIKIMKISIILTVGWIPGVYRAFKNLYYLKKSTNN